MMDEKVRYDGRLHKIYKGVRGGKYIMSGGTKLYLSRSKVTKGGSKVTKGMRGRGRKRVMKGGGELKVNFYEYTNLNHQTQGEKLSLPSHFGNSQEYDPITNDIFVSSKDVINQKGGYTKKWFEKCYESIIYRPNTGEPGAGMDTELEVSKVLYTQEQKELYPQLLHECAQIYAINYDIMDELLDTHIVKQDLKNDYNIVNNAANNAANNGLVERSTKYDACIAILTSLDNEKKNFIDIFNQSSSVKIDVEKIEELLSKNNKNLNNQNLNKLIDALTNNSNKISNKKNLRDILKNIKTLHVKSKSTIRDYVDYYKKISAERNDIPNINNSYFNVFSNKINFPLTLIGFQDAKRHFDFTIDPLLDTLKKKKAVSSNINRNFTKDVRPEDMDYTIIRRPGNSTKTPLVSINISHYQGYILKVKLKPDCKVIMFGDIHGSYHVFFRHMTRLENAGIISYNDGDEPFVNGNYTLLFLGDLIDRGYYSMEILLYLLKLIKNSSKMSVLINRGNHEFQNVFAQFGLASEISEKSHNPSQLTKCMLDFFTVCPTAIILIDSNDNKVFCCHGCIDQNLDLRGFMASPTNKLLLNWHQTANLAWTDINVHSVEDYTQIAKGGRTIISSKLINKYLAEQGFALLFRGHQDSACNTTLGITNICKAVFPGEIIVNLNLEDFGLTSLFQSINDHIKVFSCEISEPIITVKDYVYTKKDGPMGFAFTKTDSKFPIIDTIKEDQFLHKQGLSTNTQKFKYTLKKITFSYANANDNYASFNLDDKSDDKSDKTKFMKAFVTVLKLLKDTTTVTIQIESSHIIRNVVQIKEISQEFKRLGIPKNSLITKVNGTNITRGSEEYTALVEGTQDIKLSILLQSNDEDNEDLILNEYNGGNLQHFTYSDDEIRYSSLNTNNLIGSLGEVDVDGNMSVYHKLDGEESLRPLEENCKIFTLSTNQDILRPVRFRDSFAYMTT